jgi:hypothetical protein
MYRKKKIIFGFAILYCTLVLRLGMALGHIKKHKKKARQQESKR